MSDTVYVEMTCEQTGRISKYVDMSREDYEEYVRIIDDDNMRRFAKDKAINRIAEKYNLDKEEPHDWDDMEDVDFRLVDPEE